MSHRPIASTLASGFFAALVALGIAAAYPALHGNTTAAIDPSSSLIGPKSTAHEISPDDAKRAKASAKDLSTAFRVAADQMLPSVVMIQTTAEVTPMAERGQRRPNAGPGENPFEGTPFEDFFRQFPGHGFGMEGVPMQPMPRSGMGSGVIIDSAGTILTNNHVVRRRQGRGQAVRRPGVQRRVRRHRSPNRHRDREDRRCEGPGAGKAGR